MHDEAFSGMTGWDVYIGECCFEGCTALEEIEISGRVKVVWREAFKGCTGLKKVIWHDNEANNPDQEIAPNVFSGCTNLKDVYLPSLNKLGYDMFDEGCSATIHTPKDSAINEYAKEHNIKCVNDFE